MDEDTEQRFRELEKRIAQLEQQVQVLDKRVDPKQISEALEGLCSEL